MNTKRIYKQLRSRVLKANLDLFNSGLIINTWGNVSECDRKNGLVAIKPSGIPYHLLRAKDIVITNIDGKVLSGSLAPSVDLPIHLEIYKNISSISGIAHTHSKWATSWAQAGLPIPILGTTHADFFIDDIPCTRPLSKKEVQQNYEKNTGITVVEKITKYNKNIPPAILCYGHGVFSWGKDSSESVKNAVILENIAEMAFTTTQINPNIKPVPKILKEKHFLRKNGTNAYYGQQ